MRYLATLIGSTDEATMRYFILVVALLDPAAVLLLLVATQRRTFVADTGAWRNKQTKLLIGKSLVGLV